MRASRRCTAGSSTKSSRAPPIKAQASLGLRKRRHFPRACRSTSGTMTPTSTPSARYWRAAASRFRSVRRRRRQAASGSRVLAKPGAGLRAYSLERPKRLVHEQKHREGNRTLARLVMVSNRLLAPRERISRAGGLAVALREALQRQGGLWLGWSGEVVDSPSASARITTAGRITYATLDLSQEDYDAYYIGYANSTLWPLCHYRLGLIEFRRAAFQGYQRVNTSFAKALLPLLRPDDIIWVHDYHLIPLGAELRKL